MTRQHRSWLAASVEPRGGPQPSQLRSYAYTVVLLMLAVLVVLVATVFEATVVHIH